MRVHTEDTFKDFQAEICSVYAISIPGLAIENHVVLKNSPVSSIRALYVIMTYPFYI